MKFNKKITVTALSTVLGLGLVGSISGAVAWYQYSTRATTSIIGTSTGQSGVLEISKDGSNWVRDLNTDDVKGSFAGKYQPVTFGATSKNGALPNQAYTTPEAGVAAMTSWQKATVGTDYLQYVVYLQARQMKDDGTFERVAKDVYLTDITFQDDATTPSGKSIIEAARVHIAVDEVPTEGDATNKGYFLISKSDLGTDGLATHGNLDLDSEEGADKVGGYEWATGRDNLIDYGDNGAQFTYDAASLQASRDTDGSIVTTGATKIATTLAESNTSKLRLTITIWNEGWAQLDPEADPSTVKAMWDPANRDGAIFNIGLTFDVGGNAFRA